MRNPHFKKFFPIKEMLVTVLKERAPDASGKTIETLASYLFAKTYSTDKIGGVIRLFKETLPDDYAKNPDLLNITERFIERKELSEEKKASLTKHAVEALHWICVDMVIYN